MKFTHRRVNNLLTLGVVLFAGYILVTPYIPSIKWIFKDKSNSAPYAGQLRSETVITGEVAPPPKENRIVIPSALVDLPILEGNGLWVVDKGGSWRKNLNTASPKEVGNTVIVAHRFTYTQPDDGFYHLDKVKIGDRFALYWEGEELLYEVSETRTVPETAVEIEYNTSDRRLTLYTCTPVLTAQNRLVVIAKPVEVTP
jgi:LPXTG-site transpeptidase (sortase) family protein